MKKFILISVGVIMGISILIGIFAVISIANIPDKNYNKSEPDFVLISRDTLRSYLGTLTKDSVLLKYGKAYPIKETFSYSAFFIDSSHISYVTDNINEKINMISQDSLQTLNFVNENGLSQKEIIDKQFSGWDGKHIKLAKAVQDALNDPDSFEHVKSTYKIDGNTIKIKMVYRAKNAFGGVLTKSASGVADMNGNLLSATLDN